MHASKAAISVEASLLLHRSLDKQFAYENLIGPVWSAPLKAWVTADHSLIQHIQQSKDFVVVDQKHDIRRLQDRLNLNFDEIVKVLDQVPVCAEGASHAEKRKSLALEIAAHATQTLALFRTTCEDLCHAHLTKPAAFDIVDVFFAPLICEFTKNLSGLALRFGKDELLAAQIFDGALGPSRREQLNSVVGSIWQAAEETCPAHQRNNAVSLAVFGSDTVLGSLALSLVEQLSSSVPKRLNAISWSNRITRTAVPFIERMAAKPISIGNQDIKQGQIVRLYLDRYSFRDRDQNDAFFGTGRHVCLGRAITQDAWRILCACLSQSPLAMTVDTVTYRDNDFMFLFPKEIHVTTTR